MPPASLRAAFLWQWLAVEGFEFLGLGEGEALPVLGDQALLAEGSEEAGDGFTGEAGHAAELFMGEGHGKGEGRGGDGGFAHAGPVEERGGELASGGGGERETAGAEQGGVVLAGHGAGGVGGDIGGGLHEAEKVGAGDGLDGGGLEGLRGDAIAGAVQNGGEAEDVAGTGDAEDQQAAFRGAGHELDAAGADDEDAVGGEAFGQNGGAGVEGE